MARPEFTQKNAWQVAEEAYAEIKEEEEDDEG
jgi:hypothetical protein